MSHKNLLKVKEVLVHLFLCTCIFCFCGPQYFLVLIRPKVTALNYSIFGGRGIRGSQGEKKKLFFLLPFSSIILCAILKTLQIMNCFY